MNSIDIPGYKNAVLYSSAKKPESIHTAADIISFAMKKMDYFFGKTFVNDLEVIIDPNASSPLNSYDGKTIILHLESNTFWDQMAYQFCHEYCHHLITSTPQISNRKWFEEIICEVSSRFFLEKLSTSNLEKKLYQEYKIHFKIYRTKIISGLEIPWNLSECLSVIDPYSSNITTKLINDIDSVGRPLLSYGATKFLPIFSSKPSLWKSVPLIYDFNPNTTFNENLDNWLINSGDKSIELIIDLFYNDSFDS